MTIRRFLVGAVINASLIVVVIWLFSLFVIPQPFPFGPDRAPIIRPTGAGLAALLVTGGILVLANRFIRPVLVALTGRLLLSSMGLWVVVINTLVVWLAAIVAPNIAQIAEPRFLWLLLAVAVFTLLATVVEAVLGLNRPALGTIPGLWRLLESLPTPRRNVLIENLRLQQVYDALYATALDIGLANTPLASVRDWFQQRVLGRTVAVDDETAPARVRVMLQQLGPTYVKIGQMMASRADVLPEEWIGELSKLQSEAEPFPWDEAAAVLARELGSPPETLFASIEREPFAAASTAQVHRATLHDGSRVAVKVQRPRIVAKTKADLGVMDELARVAERRFAIARKIGLRAMVAEFAAGVLKELDYRNEAYHAHRLADAMTRFPQVHIPVVYEDLSSPRVLTMEFVDGIKISKIDELRAAGFDTAELGTVFIKAIIKQVLIDGFFHGDPHPGNVLADPASKRIVFLDLGLVGQLNQSQRVDLLGLIYAVRSVDLPGIADGLIALGKPGRGFNEVAFRDDIDRLGRQYLVYGKATSLGAALGSFLGAVFDRGLQLDSQLTLALKAVIQAEETARALSFDIDLGAAAMEEARAALLESLDPDRVFKQLQGTALRLGKEMARRVPTLDQAAFKWLDMFNRGRIVVEVDTSDLTKGITRVSDVGRQAATGLIIVGQLIGTAIVMAILLQPGLSQFAGVAYLAMIAFAVTLVVSFVVLFRIVTGPGTIDDS